MSGFKGGCLCGSIAYEVSSDPVNIWNCHCDDCRKATGGSFATNVFVQAQNLIITSGAPNTYQSSSDSGNTMTREFCSNCGPQLFVGNSARPEFKAVRVGSIEDADFVQPWANIYVSKALPFVKLGANLENFEKAPPNPGKYIRA